MQLVNYFFCPAKGGEQPRQEGDLRLRRPERRPRPLPALPAPLLLLLRHVLRHLVGRLGGQD